MELYKFETNFGYISSERGNHAQMSLFYLFFLLLFYLLLLSDCGPLVFKSYHRSYHNSDKPPNRSAFTSSSTTKYLNKRFNKPAYVNYNTLPIKSKSQFVIKYILTYRFVIYLNSLSAYFNLRICSSTYNRWGWLYLMILTC